MSDQTSKGVGIRITSDPDVTSIEQPGEGALRTPGPLPLRLLLVSDLAPHETEVDWQATSRVRRVDKHSVAALLQELQPRLSLEVPNTLGEQPRLLDVELAFSSLDDFRPAQVARQVPPLARLLKVRTCVQQVRDGRLDRDAFRACLAETGIDPGWAEQLHQALVVPERPAAPPPPASPAGDDPVDRLLGMVEAGDRKAGPSSPERADGGSGLFGSFIAAVAGDARPAERIEKATADVLLADLDAMLGKQLNAIFAHPAFRRLEAAWRGLKFLVDRLDFRRNVILEVLATPRASLSEALYYQVLLPEHAAEGEQPPLSMVVLDLAFDNSPADIEQLEDLAETGASLQTPILAAAAPAFFGVSRPQELATLPPLLQRLGEPAYIAWNKLRDRQEARFLALALPPFALRYAYGPDQPVKEFHFEEAACLWGNASLAVAAAIAGGFVHTGWPTRFVGPEHRVEDLPLWRSPQGQTPLSVLIPDAKLSEFAKAGFVVLQGRPNHDALHVARALTVGRPETYEDLMAATEARVHVTLPCQLFVARAAHYVLALQHRLQPTPDPAQTRQQIWQHLQALFRTEGQPVPAEAVEVEHVKEANLPEHELFAVRLRTPPYVLSRPVSLVLGLRVPKGAGPAENGNAEGAD
ncbi:MAG: hypothetical protein KatS3mg043_1409 [Rhodothermaceae bacterium]|nr:MAG: hypothetical protein KatS3mg043_1409 [Rhodothermaceae bacterium]